MNSQLLGVCAMVFAASQGPLSNSLRLDVHNQRYRVLCALNNQLCDTLTLDTMQRYGALIGIFNRLPVMTTELQRSLHEVTRAPVQVDDADV